MYTHVCICTYCYVSIIIGNIYAHRLTCLCIILPGAQTQPKMDSFAVGPHIIDAPDYLSHPVPHPFPNHLVCEAISRFRSPLKWHVRDII